MFLATLGYTSYQQYYKLKKWVFPMSVLLLGCDVFAFMVMTQKGKDYDSYVKELDDKYRFQGYM